MGEMWRFIWGRCLSLLSSLFVASLLIFFVLDILPGDPAPFMLGMNATPESLIALRGRLGFDEPALSRYFDWISGFFRGDLGESHTYRIPVVELISGRLYVSLPLALYALILSLFIAFPLGLFAAVRRGVFSGAMVTGASQLALAVPSFWLAMLLVWVFAITLRLFPAGGFPGWETGFFPSMQALFLPAVSLAFPQSFILLRVLRSSLREEMVRDYMRAARAKGATRRRALWRHALGNTLVPVLNVVGLQFSFLLSSAIVIETLFFLPGLGRLLFQAVEQRDFILVRTIAMLLVCAGIVVTFLVELSCAVIDPRLRGRVK